MRIIYASDLHLEFGALNVLPPDGDIAILAGDTINAGCLDPRRTDKHNRKQRQRAHAFFDDLRQRFDHVLVVAGNHEAYREDIDRSVDLMRQYLADDVVHVLERGRVEINEVLFLGCTLWSDFEKRKPSSLLDCAHGMNDFLLIAHGKHRWSPEAAADRFDESVEWLSSELASAKPRQTACVITHHAPSLLGLHPDYGGNGLDGAFASDLHEFIETRPTIRHWIFGHTHVRTRFQIGRTAVVSAARGYVDTGEAQGFEWGEISLVEDC